MTTTQIYTAGPAHVPGSIITEVTCRVGHDLVACRHSIDCQGTQLRADGSHRSLDRSRAIGRPIRTSQGPRALVDVALRSGWSSYEIELLREALASAGVAA